MAKHINLTDTSKLIKAALKVAYPKTKFSVRSESYSGGSSINVRWTDGPLSRDVDSILDLFAGAGFDGMQDLKYLLPPVAFRGELVEFGVDFVHGQRRISVDLVRRGAQEVHEKTGLPLLEVLEDKWGGATIPGGNTAVPWRYLRYHGSEAGILVQDDVRGEWYRDLIYAYSHDLATEERSGNPELPEPVHEKLSELTVDSGIKVN